MSDRCILALRFTPAGSLGLVRKTVGGFLRYVQHRDLHPKERVGAADPRVSGLVKYVAYRDQASARAELFGPSGTIGSAERKAFAAYVSRSIEGSRPQPYRARDGKTADRRRAVYRMVISPEHAAGLDLRQLTAAVVGGLERELGISGLRWMAAIHRNTAHPHVHLVLAGMRETADGYARVDITKPRLTAIKQSLAIELQRQRGERSAKRSVTEPVAGVVRSRERHMPALKVPVARPALIRLLPLTPRARLLVAISRSSLWPTSPAVAGPLLALRSAGRRYQLQMQRQLEDEARRSGWERAA